LTLFHQKTLIVMEVPQIKQKVQSNGKRQKKFRATHKVKVLAYNKLRMRTVRKLEKEKRNKSEILQEDYRRKERDRKTVTITCYAWDKCSLCTGQLRTRHA